MPGDFDAFQEVQFGYDILIRKGQMKWQNIVLVRWEQAYRRAYGKVYDKKNVSPRAVFLAVGGIILGELTGIEFIFAPLMLALEDWKKPTPKVPLKTTQAPDDFVADRKSEFAQMMDACAGQILSILGDVKSGKGYMSEQEWHSFLGNALLSPVWWPPKAPDVDDLAKRIERRIWAVAAGNNTKDGGLVSDALVGIKAIGQLPGDTDSLDFGKIEDFYHEAAKLMNAYDAVGKIDYEKGNSEVAQDWRRYLYPIAAELSRPPPLEYPLPGYVQAYLDHATKVKAAADKKGTGTSPHMLLAGAIPAPVHSKWWVSVDQWQGQ
jgi:hypothetical protein